jgi:two-component system response regulator FixJ
LNDHSHPPAHQRGRLVYLTHPDAAIGKVVYDSFVDRGFLASMLPDVAAIARLVTIRRPDLVVMPLGDTTPEVDETLGVLDAIRGLHLGIALFLLAPEGARAELVTAAVRRGAAEVFSPPYSAADIVATAERALGADVLAPAGADSEPTVAVGGFGTLTYREQQILQLVVEGRTNKEIAAEFGLSYRTVEVHRRHILGKTGARNTAELVRMALER